MRLIIAIFATCSLLHVTFAVQCDVFSTKTSYFWSRNASSVSRNIGRFAIGQDICDSVYVNMVARHGARNPTSSSIKEISRLHTMLVNHKSPNKFLFLDHWPNRYDLSTQGELVPAGADEEEFLGTRFGESFRDLFDVQRQAQTKVDFVTSNKQRTIDSARNFYTGFAQKTGVSSPFTSHVNDSLTRFYDGCTRYETMVTDNDTNFREFNDFSSTSEFQQVGTAVKQRLGLKVGLTPDELYTIYDLCAYETYIFNDTAWCSLMTDAERKVLEYGMDVKNYFESMYGNPLNAEVACPLVRDIFYSMDEVIRTLNTTANGGTKSGEAVSSYVAGKFEFGHSETMAKLLAALGLFKDNPGIMSSNMATMEDRKFRSSHVIPYASNTAFVLYSCGPNSGQKNSFKVKLFVNEEAVALPICGKQFVCDYQTLRQAYSMLIDTCDEKRFCAMQSGAVVG